jgi:hypothetical protein
MLLNYFFCIILFVNKFKNTLMLRTKKSDLIKSSYRLAALIILISININTLSAQSAGVVREKGGPKAKGTQIGTTSTTPIQNKVVNTNKKIGKPSIELQKAMESMQAEEAKEAANTHKIGESYGGGIVFHITDNGLHGLIAETQDQGSRSDWNNARRIISNSSKHSKEGQKFTDWRLPTKNELNLLFLKKDFVGGFKDQPYWSSTEFDNGFAWYQDFNDGGQYSRHFKGNSYYVRAIRAF